MDIYSESIPTWQFIAGYIIGCMSTAVGPMITITELQEQIKMKKIHYKEHPYRP